MLEDKAQNVMADMSALLPLLVSNALNALAAIVILLIGLWLSGRAAQLVVTSCGERRISTRCCKASSAALPATWS
jgi:small conductance mechanosensitive channel